MLGRFIPEIIGFLLYAVLWPTYGESLKEAIENNRLKVPQFRFIREEADKLGVRVFLFGGTSAGFAHHIRFAREAAQAGAKSRRFDLDFTNIYRSSQDLDIVIDGSPEQASALRQMLLEKFPAFQGKKSQWEVRLLRKGFETKEALLDNPDIQNQHTDSQSIGTIELTEPRNREPIIRDILHWNESRCDFLEDVEKAQIRFYFSFLHSKTTRFKKNMNPPIFAAIRYLTKAFQFDLKMIPEDRQRVQGIIDEFRGSKDLKTEYAIGWMERNGKKILGNAQDLEAAWNEIESMKLRKKLIGLGNSAQVDSLSWLLSREPLRTRPLATKGQTARELGISEISHETKDFGILESMIGSVRGIPNVLISRPWSRGERAALGKGFYARIGRAGAIGNGLTIRFLLHPDARLGKDFLKSDDYIVVLNRAAISVIPESLDLSPKEYLKAIGDFREDDSNRGLLMRFKNQVLWKFSSGENSEHFREALAILEIAAESWVWNRYVIAEALSLLVSKPDILNQVDAVIAEKILNPHIGRDHLMQFLEDNLSQLSKYRLPQTEERISDLLDTHPIDEELQIFWRLLQLRGSSMSELGEHETSKRLNPTSAKDLEFLDRFFEYASSSAINKNVFDLLKKLVLSVPPDRLKGISDHVVFKKFFRSGNKRSASVWSLFTTFVVCVWNIMGTAILQQQRILLPGTPAGKIFEFVALASPLVLGPLIASLVFRAKSRLIFSKDFSKAEIKEIRRRLRSALFIADSAKRADMLERGVGDSPKLRQRLSRCLAPLAMLRKN